MPVQAKGAVFTRRDRAERGRSHRLGRHARGLRGARRRDPERLAGLRAYHSLYYSQGRAGYLPSKNDQGGYNGYGYHDGEAPLRPLVKVHPDTGRPNLLIGRHAYGIVGMDPDESERFLDRLNDGLPGRPRLLPPVGRSATP